MGLLEQNSGNPYSADVREDAFVKTSGLHHHYRLSGDRLYCRSGLILPQYCLVTGASEDLVPFPVLLQGHGKRSRYLQFVGVVCLMTAALTFGAVLLLLSMRISLRLSDKHIINASGLPLICIGIVLIVLGARSRYQCRLHFVMRRQLQVARRRRVMITLAAIVAVCAVRFSGMFSNNWLWGGISFAMFFACVVTDHFLLPGLHLKAVVDGQESFEIRGCSKAFLQRLEEQSRGS